MTIQEAYKRFLLKIGKNDTNDTISISPAEFVYIFNEQSLVWLSDKISQKASTDNINDIQELLIQDLPVSNFTEKEKYNEFVLPEDYYHFVSASALAEKGGCEKFIDVFNIKPKEKNIWLRDEMNNPSFEWEETISILSENKIQVYKSDFDILSLNISYYKMPNKVDIEGYIGIEDKKPSTTIHPNLSDENVNEIINRCAVEVDINYKNSEAFQLDQQRVLTENKQ